MTKRNPHPPRDDRDLITQIAGDAPELVGRMIDQLCSHCTERRKEAPLPECRHNLLPLTSKHEPCPYYSPGDKKPL